MLNPYLSWKYKQELEITNPSETEGLQVSFTLVYQPGMRYDFRDLRFSTKTGTNIPYFLESVVNFTSVLVWLKLPASTEKIYMFYGNGFVSSASSGTAVFRFYDGFSTLDLSIWSKAWGSSYVSNGYLYVGGNSLNNILESKTTYGYNSIVEARVSHPIKNSFHVGFRSTSSGKRCDWYVDSACSNVDIASTYNGSSGTYEEDINRYGSTFYVYGVAHLNGSSLFYVDHVLKKTITTTLPAVSLPINFYSEVGRGNVIIDWVRIRTYSATMPTISLGRKVLNTPKTYPFNIAETASATLELCPDAIIKRYTTVNTNLTLNAATAIKRPLYYRKAIHGPYTRWKYRGDVRLHVASRPVQVDIVRLPGMTADGRDIRFTDIHGDVIKYNIFSITGDVFSIWVDAPAEATKINFYYGNGAAIDESDPSITSTELVTTEYYLPARPGPYNKWKFQGDVEIPSVLNYETVQRVEISQLPGMTGDARDLRFSKGSEEISYKIESISSGVITCLVEWPADAPKINFHYGNGSAISESDSGITLDPIVTTVSMPSSPEFLQWKFGGHLRISSTPTEDTEILIEISRLPGMTLDGRDLRFADIYGNSINYFLESLDSLKFNIWVLWPANTPKIKFFYGNGAAVSESSAAGVFRFFDDFDTLSSEWNIVNGSATVSDSHLIMGDTDLNCMIESASVFGTGYTIEFKMYHPNTNNTIAGFWNHTTSKRTTWHASSSSPYNDYCYTHNGSSFTATNDNVNRAGTTFYTYRIDRGSSSASFYVNGSFRRSVSTTLPTGDLPIGFYSTVNKGDLVVDWIRVRKTTTATVTIERHFPRTVAGYQTSEAQATTAYVSRHYPRWQTTIKMDYPVESATIERHYPRWTTAIKYYDYLAPKGNLILQADDPVTVSRKTLKDYSVTAIDVTRSINDTYLQLSTEFQDLVYPPEDSTVKHIATDSDGAEHLLFFGKIISLSPNLRYVGNTVSMQAADLSMSLAVQKIPWNYQVVDGEDDSWYNWIVTLLDSSSTGVYARNIIDRQTETKQFVFKPETTRLSAINDIAAFMGCITHTKLATRIIAGETVIRPEFYCVPPEDIDLSANGFDLPDPITLTYPDTSLVDEPKISSGQDQRYNKVTVHGVLSDTGETVVASAFTVEVYSGEQKAKEYIYEDNSITEKGSTAEIEAIKWLLYFLSKPTTVSMQFVNRFDLELYQRIKLGAGFNNTLKSLTTRSQVSIVYACDPTDAANSTHSVDVSGVPRPSWLRISKVSYHGEDTLETCSIEAVTDFIYSSADPQVNEPYSTYLSPGYFKPELDDLVSTTKSIVENTLQKQLLPELGTILSIDEENKTYLIQTQSGKLVTARYA